MPKAPTVAARKRPSPQPDRRGSLPPVRRAPPPPARHVSPETYSRRPLPADRHDALPSAPRRALPANRPPPPMPARASDETTLDGGQGEVIREGDIRPSRSLASKRREAACDIANALGRTSYYSLKTGVRYPARPPPAAFEPTVFKQPAREIPGASGWHQALAEKRRATAKRERAEAEKAKKEFLKKEVEEMGKRMDRAAAALPVPEKRRQRNPLAKPPPKKPAAAAPQPPRKRQRVEGESEPIGHTQKRRKEGEERHLLSLRRRSPSQMPARAAAAQPPERPRAMKPAPRMVTVAERIRQMDQAEEDKKEAAKKREERFQMERERATFRKQIRESKQDMDDALFG
ncbi:hypothetical protein K490DRAFT_61891 [Saccharata proteae CBS 121410]|uniref:Uncharacterized protein n=1 Tax=Saccharata proteae CBS 121410 TaxID=1314787 RepID=A0A9P4I1N4_9PEZI|nr:hypothetical protein K490DRAFT_61891 [Saccharata proteae CBS 121410]